MANPLKDQLPVLESDGAFTPDVGEWAYKKYLRVWMYDEIFTKAMREKYTLVYLDLFAGAGRAHLRDSGRIVPSSTILALDLPHRFHRYIFCEADPLRIEALRARVKAAAPDADVHFVEGDVNRRLDCVIPLIPEGALSFCFVDPCGIGIRLETLRRLSDGRRMDILVLLAVQMDINRNRTIYTAEDATQLDAFLGHREWRAEWADAQQTGTDFRVFIVDQFVRSMMRIGYAETRMEELYQMRSETPTRRGIPIYYLAFFSKNELGKKFWKEVLKYNEPQGDLFA